MVDQFIHLVKQIYSHLSNTHQIYQTEHAFE